jgi:cephalosporin hydroxylase
VLSNCISTDPAHSLQALKQQQRQQVVKAAEDANHQIEQVVISLLKTPLLN